MPAWEYVVNNWNVKLSEWVGKSFNDIFFLVLLHSCREKVICLPQPEGKGRVHLIRAKVWTSLDLLPPPPELNEPFSNEICMSVTCRILPEPGATPHWCRH